MKNKRWLIHIVLRSLSWRGGRSLLLLTVVAMAASLITALGIVSDTMETRVAGELKRYGANLLLLPSGDAAGVDGLSFINQEGALRLLTDRRDLVSDYSPYFREAISTTKGDLPAEGVDFVRTRRLFPWWQVRGGWPATGDGVILGSDLAAALSLGPGARLAVDGPSGPVTLVVAGIVATGGDEDKLLFLDLAMLQQLTGTRGKISGVRMLAAGGAAVGRTATTLSSLLPGLQVREVREVARTSEELLRKVKLLMTLVAGVVLVMSAGSVAGAMSATVLERGREIGLMRAVGASRRTVLMIFALEAAAFGVAGGCCGFLAGVGIAAVVMKTVFAAPAGIAPVYLPIAAGAGLILALSGSLGPLLSVYRLDPVQSLRGE